MTEGVGLRQINHLKNKQMCNFIFEKSLNIILKMTELEGNLDRWYPLFSMLMMAFPAVTHGGCETSWSWCDRPPTPPPPPTPPTTPPRLFPAGCLVSSPSRGATVASSGSGIDRPLAKPHRLRPVTPPWVPDHRRNLSENIRAAINGRPGRVWRVSCSCFS